MKRKRGAGNSSPAKTRRTVHTKRRSKVAKPRRRRGVDTKARKSALKPPRAAQTVEALQAQIRRLRSARTRLERRLTSAVKEIGMLRQIEFRVQRLEDELAERDQEISRLRMERADQLRQLELRLGGASILSTPS
jgi:predicted RNase H-like nuclease (RuvC/YqgF family)